jgi:hypothetical protein
MISTSLEYSILNKESSDSHLNLNGVQKTIVLQDKKKILLSGQTSLNKDTKYAEEKTFD